MSAEVPSRKIKLASGRSIASEKLRTYPEKWDVSHFQSPTTSSGRNGRSADVRSPHERQASPEDESADWQPEAFPEPRTIPGKWDTSGLS